MARQGFTSNSAGVPGEVDPYIYQETNAGTSSAMGLDSGDSRFKVAVSSTIGASPNIAIVQITIDPATNNITLNPDTGTVIIDSPGTVQIAALTAGVMQTSSTGIVSSSNGTSGQLLIGGGLAPVWANLTSTGASVTITNGANSINIEASGVGGLTQLDGDSGSALPSSGVIKIAGGNLVSTSASGNIVTINVAGGTDGQIIVASTAGSPAFSTLTSSGGTITFTAGSNTLNLDGTSASTTQPGVVALATNAETIAGSVTTKATTPDDIKAKLGTQTNHGVLVGAGQTSAITALAVGATNTVLLGNTGADPSFGTVPNAALTNSTITLNNGNNITVTGSPISLGGSASIEVSGTTNHAVQIGNASGSLSSLTVGSNGQVLLGATSADPAFATLTSTGGTITYITGANTLNLDGTPATTIQSGVVSLATNAETIAGTVTTKAITPDDLKAKLGTQTDHGVLVGAGTSTAVTALAVGATNTVLLGNTGADPSFGTVPNAALTNSSITLTSGNNINVSTSPVSLGGSTTISVVGTTNHAVQIGNASASLTSLAVGLNGQILIGASSNNPAFANLTSSDSSITITTGANTLDIKTAHATGVSSVTGTTNQVTTSPTTGAVVVSTPSVFIAPGSIASTTTNAAGTNFLLPTTSSTAGQLQINSIRAFHTYGTNNTFLGSGTGNFTLTGTDNTCIGFQAGASIAVNSNNTYVGSLAGTADAGGGVGNSGNTGIGDLSLTSYTGSTGARNTAIGAQSLQSLLTGQHNTIMGWGAAGNYTTSESDNILIGYLTNGVTGESNTLRIGTATGTLAGYLNSAFIQGIAGKTVLSSSAVLINTTTGQLGTIVSSQRYKQDIEPLITSPVLSMTPVTFRYKEDTTELHYGLIAEDVEQYMPDMVVYKDGLPETVRYHELPILLLAEIKKLRSELDTLKESLNGN